MCGAVNPPKTSAASTNPPSKNMNRTQIDRFPKYDVVYGDVSHRKIPVTVIGSADRITDVRHAYTDCKNRAEHAVSQCKVLQQRLKELGAEW